VWVPVHSLPPGILGLVALHVQDERFPQEARDFIARVQAGNLPEQLKVPADFLALQKNPAGLIEGAKQTPYRNPKRAMKKAKKLAAKNMRGG